MKKIYCFFEMIYFQLRNLNLRGQSADNNSHFAAIILVLLIDLNILSLLIFANKMDVLNIRIVNGYYLLGLVLLTFTIVYFLFVRSSKYNLIKNKYMAVDGIKKNYINLYLSIYVIGTIMVIFFSVNNLTHKFFLKYYCICPPNYY